MMRFCGACGAPLDARDVATSDDGLDEELRHVTVLFADLVGFTTFSEARTADEVGSVVAAVLPRLFTVLRRSGGTAEKYLGDAVLSTFGLRQPDPHAGRSAVRAALELQTTMADIRSETGRDLHLRVGVHSGEVMVRRIGNVWGVVGDTVNTAARLQEVADPDTVWISRSTYEEVRRHVEALPRPTLSLKGKSLPVQPYEVRRERDAAGVLALPFTGRDKEFALLTGELEAAVEQSTMRVVVVRGQAGVGKTRLVTELRDRLEAEERLFRLDRVEYDRGDVQPAGGLATLIRHRFHISPDADDDTALAELRAAAPDELGEPYDEQHLDFLAFALGLPVTDSGIAALDTEAVWTGVHAALHAWMQARAARDPWVVTFEDAHFGDPETAAFLDWSLEVGWSAPAFVLITVRDEDVGSGWQDRLARWVESGAATEVTLHELEPHELAGALSGLPGLHLPAGVTERIAEHAEGHPLFALELVDFLANAGALANPAVMSETVLPATVREAMEARIERLGLEGKQIAKRAAFIGRRFTREAVARLWDGTDDAMERGFEALRRSRAVFEEWTLGTEGVVEMVFRHGRLQEAALARVPREEQLRWHERLEDWARDRLEDTPEAFDRVGAEAIPLIARSRVAHGDEAGAADWFETLGLLHRRQHRITEAAQAFLAAAERTRGTRRQLLQLRAAAAVSAWGDLGRALDILETTDDDADTGTFDPGPLLARGTEGPLDRWWDVDQEEALLVRRLRRADLLSRTGRVVEAAREFELLGERLTPLRSTHAEQLRLQWGRDYVYFLVEVQGDVVAAEEVMRKATAALSAQEQPPYEVLVMDDYIAMRSGDLHRGVSTASARLERARAQGDLVEESVAWNTMGIVRSALGDLTGSLSAYESSLRLARDIGDLRGEAIALHNIGLLHLDRGELARARELTEQYLERSSRIGNRMAESFAPIYLGAIAAMEGDAAAATRLVKEGWDAADRHGWPRLVALASAMLGEVQVLHGLRTGEPEVVAWGATKVLDGEAEWRSLDERGELYAVAAVGQLLIGRPDVARELVTRAGEGTHPEGSLVRAWLDATEAIVTGGDPGAALEWLRDRDFHRATWMLELLAAGAARAGQQA
jgi:class 3 adenylate cyclase/tetratricopeptide (TPR) repeat protein